MGDRAWVLLAACRGQDDIMFDPTLIDVATDLCKTCLVLDECRTMFAGWEQATPDSIPMCVVAGLNRHVTRYGQPRRIGLVMHRCFTCQQPMYLPPGERRRYCTQACEPTDTIPIDSIRELSQTLDRLIESSSI